MHEPALKKEGFSYTNPNKFIFETLNLFPLDAYMESLPRFIGHVGSKVMQEPLPKGIV